jgi:hypothetical protein
MIAARYTWNTEALRPGFAVHHRSLTISKVAPIGGAICLLAALYYVAVQSRSWIEGLPFIIFGTFLLFARPLAFWQFRRAIMRSPSYGSVITYTFTTDQFAISGEGHDATIAWTKLYSATESKGGLLLYPQKNLFHWIPATAFDSPSDIATVCGYLERHHVPTRHT